jgi:DNA-binding response OmpR family regulator
VKPDVVVVDMGLGGVSGLELTRRLRGDAQARGVRIIVLTGHTFGGMRSKAEDAGCDRVLVKPCLPDVLALEIRDLLHQPGHELESGLNAAVTDGATKRCPRCRGTLVFTSRHPILTIGLTLERRDAERTDRIRYESAWVCQSGRCDYRELVREA